MKESGSALTPFLRSDALGALLAELMREPRPELSLAELARRAGLSQPLVHKEVGRLAEAQVVVDRRDGRNRLVRANDKHPLFGPMRELIEATYGPMPVLRASLADVPGIDRAFIYGSWAERRSGVEGPPPADIDLLVVGKVSRRALAEAAARAGAELGVPVNPTRVGARDWGSPDPSPFLATVRERPLIEVTGFRNE